jgi:hypothetical protein
MERLTLIFIVIGLIIAHLAHGEQSPAGAQPAVESPGARLITLDFPGGTVAQYIDAVRKASDDANIVVIGDVTPIPMPPVKLKNVDAWAAVNILNSMPQHQKDLYVKMDADITSHERDQSRVYVVTAQVTRSNGLGGPVESTVLSVLDVLQDHLTADDLLTAVQIAQEVIGNPDQPADIKFHKETGLLIARGTREQIAGIHQVVEQLRQQAVRKMNPKEQAELKNAANKIEELERIKMTLENNLGQARQQVLECHDALKPLRDRVAQLEELLAKRTPE